MVFRIKLNSIRLYRLNASSGGNAGTEDNDVVPGVDVSFSTSPAILSGWHSDRTAWPRTSVDFPVAEADRGRMNVWLTGNTVGSLNPPSEKLLRDMTSAVKNAMTSYFESATSHSLLTAPFRVSAALSNGSRRTPLIFKPVVMELNPHSPIMAMREFSYNGDNLHTAVDIINRPSGLRVKVSPQEGFPGWGPFTHLDIVAAPQAGLIPDNLKVDSLRTVEEEGTLYRAYHYDRLDRDTVIGEAAVQTDFRILMSIPLDDLTAGTDNDVDIPAGILTNWKLLPKFSALAGTGGTTDSTAADNIYDPEVWEPAVDFETEPLDLGQPEKRKWVRNMWLRGIYDRKSVTVTLYASRHREDWIPVAQGSRGWISGVSAMGFRWWKVRVKGTLREGDSLDALTFEGHI